MSLVAAALQKRKVKCKGEFVELGGFLAAVGAQAGHNFLQRMPVFQRHVHLTQQIQNYRMLWCLTADPLKGGQALFVAFAQKLHTRLGKCDCQGAGGTDRKSTRLNSSHVAISYAVFCLKKEKVNNRIE